MLWLWIFLFAFWVINFALGLLEMRLGLRLTKKMTKIHFAIGAIIDLIARLEFWKHKVPLWPNGWAPPRFVQTGIYRFFRHRMYLGGCLFYIGYNSVCRALYALYFIVPLVIAALLFRAYLEERYILEPKFGEEYREYQRRTGMLLPFIGKKLS